MDESSVTPSPQESLEESLAIFADEGFCRQVAALLFCDRKPIRDAFIGEPFEEVLQMVRWVMKHEGDEGFDAERVLTAWAEKRGRGAWSDRPRSPEPQEHNPKERDPYAELAQALAKYWAEHPGELTDLLDRAEASAKASMDVFANGRGA